MKIAPAKKRFGLLEDVTAVRCREAGRTGLGHVRSGFGEGRRRDLLRGLAERGPEVLHQGPALEPGTHVEPLRDTP